MSIFKRKKKGRREGMTTFKAGVIGLVIILVATYLGFTKFKLPFVNSQYTVHAVFSNANQLRPNSFVRIAGINVGVVKTIEPVTSCAGQPQPCSAANVTMAIQDNGLPIHTDATFAIRPRIFLEGNFFVDLHPGSPSAPKAPDGYTFPIQQGTMPVQFDQVLTSLQSDTRRNLQVVLQQYGTAVQQAGPSINGAVKYWLPAYNYSAQVTHDLLGKHPHDLSTFFKQGARTAGAIDAHPQNLLSFISDFNTTAHALAIENTNLQNTVSELPRTLSQAIPAFNALNAAFPPTEQLARELVPGVQSTGRMIPVTLPFIHQLRLLVQPSELQGLARDLSVTIPNLAQLTNRTIPLLRDEVRPASSCAANTIYPWSQLTVPDEHFNASNGFPPRKVYQEAVDYLPGLAGESRNFDANGPYIRVGLSPGASLTYSLSNAFFGQSGVPLTGAQPPLPPGGKRPPLAGGDAPNKPCETQPAIRDLSAPTTSAPKPQPNVLPTPTLPVPVPAPPGTVPPVTVPKVP